MRVDVDASAVLALLLRTPEAEGIRKRLGEARGNVHAPHLLDVEVTQALRRLAVVDPGQAERCRQALQDLREMPVFRHSHHTFLDRVWDLRQHFAATAANYLALAEYLSAPLLTCDDQLKTSGRDVEIEYVGDTNNAL